MLSMLDLPSWDISPRNEPDVKPEPQPCSHPYVLLLDGEPITELRFKGLGYRNARPVTTGHRTTVYGKTGWFCLECFEIVAKA